MHALLACTSIAAVYVAPFYLQRKLPRNHNATILFRAALACAACCCTWLPLFLALQVTFLLTFLLTYCPWCSAHTVRFSSSLNIIVCCVGALEGRTGGFAHSAAITGPAWGGHSSCDIAASAADGAALPGAALHAGLGLAV